MFTLQKNRMPNLMPNDVGLIHEKRYKNKIKNNLKNDQKEEVFEILKNYVNYEEEKDTNIDRNSFRSTGYFLDENNKKNQENTMIKTNEDFARDLKAEKILEGLKFVRIL